MAPKTATALAALLAWTAASSALIVLNKRVMVDGGFGFPLALTGAGQLVSAALAWGAAGSGLAPPLGPAPRSVADAARLAPAVFCSAGTLYFGNAAYLSLSVSFIQILKVLMPAATLAAGAAAGLERVTPLLAGAVGLICAGAAAATAEEVGRGGKGASSTAHARFAWAGLVSFLVSVALEAGRVVYMQRLLSGSGGQKQARARDLGRGARPAPVRPYSSLEVCAFLGPPTGLVLLACSAAFEWRAGLSTAGLAAAAAHPARLALALAMGFAVNATTAAAIAATSSLTFKVWGTAKNAGVVALGVVLEGDEVSAAQLGGYGLSLAGFWLYCVAKAAVGPAQPRGAKAAVRGTTAVLADGRPRRSGRLAGAG